MGPFYHSDGKLSYPISELNSGTINYQTLIELIIDEYGDGTYISKNATIEMFGDYLVSSHAIFNVLNDVFNDKTIADTNDNGDAIYRYASDLYIASSTYFLNNPYSDDISSRIESLELNQTITKRQLQRYIQEHGMEIDTIKDYYSFFKWNKSENGFWEVDTTVPKISELTCVPFNLSGNNFVALTSTIGSFWHGCSNQIRVERNTIINIVGAIELPSGWNDESTRYFIPEYNLWVALLNRKEETHHKPIFGLTELHNIVKKTIDGTDHYIAYFSFSLPMTIDSRFSIVFPFEPGTSVSGIGISGTLFEKLNTSNTAFAYYWGENLYDDDSNVVVDPNIH